MTRTILVVFVGHFIFATCTRRVLALQFSRQQTKLSRRILEIRQSVVAEVHDDETSINEQQPTPPNSRRRFMYMTKEQDQELRERGDHEAQLMKKHQTKLKVTKIKASRSASGFGNNSKKGKDVDARTTDFKTQAVEYSKVLYSDGFVCIDNVLPGSLADDLRDYLVDLRARATNEIEDGVILDTHERFADVLLNQNRCDLKIPLGPPVVNKSLHHILSQTVIPTLVEYVYDNFGGGGKEATLYELNCFMSNSGARRQLVHADNVCVADQPGLKPEEPIMLTCFIALQDTDASMGPTSFIPGTHNLEAHKMFFENGNPQEELNGGESTKDWLLRTRKNVLGVLSKGSCIFFDPRTLHCAGANNCIDPARTRALFYFSFKNPRVDHPGCPSCGGYGIPTAEMTLELLRSSLNAEAQGQADSHRILDMLACFP